MLTLAPADGEYTLRHEDILAAIEKHGESIALVLLPGVQYYTGQYFKLAEITEAAHRKVMCVCADVSILTCLTHTI
jgi:kynureninase